MQTQQPLPRLRSLISRGRRRGRRALTPAAYNYKTDCAGAQKLFYIGFVLSSIASVAFLISFVFNSGGKVGGSELNFMGAGANSTLMVERPPTVGRRRELGLFETLALLCSAFGLCLIAGVFLCGLYVTRRRKDIGEERLIARVGGARGCWDADADEEDCEDDATQTTETPGGELSSYSIASGVATGPLVQPDGNCDECGCRRTPCRQGDEAGLDEEDDEEDLEEEEDADFEDAATRGGNPEETEKPAQQPAAAERLVLQALNSGVSRRLRRCTCAQISTVSRLSEQRRTTADSMSGRNSVARGAAAQQGFFETSDQSIAFF